MLTVLGCITREHDLRLVVLAALICGLGCFSTVNLLMRALAVARRAAGSWLIAAAAVFGCSVWSLHFIAMLAFMPRMAIAYDVTLTVTSVAIAVGGALLALLVWRLSPSRVVGAMAGGILIGLAVTAMHYTGVAAMRLPGRITFDRPEVVASIIASLVFGTLGLARIGVALPLRRQVEASIWLGLSIVGLHFIGMTAMRITPGAPPNLNHAVLGSGILAIAVGSISLAILAVSLAATFMERHFARLAAREACLLRQVNDLSHDVIMIHRHGIVVDVNGAGSRLFGMSTAAIVGRPIAAFFADASLPVLRRIRRGMDGVWPDEMEITTATGQHVPVECSSRTIDFKDRPATALALRDISERKRDEARIQHLAHHDILTDLPSRLLLQKRLERAIADAIATASRVAVLYLDLDRFKPANDVFGRAGGDAVLIQVSARLLEALGASDTLARVGSDEFVIVVERAEPPAKIAALAARLIEGIDRPFTFEEREVSIGVSIGIAVYPSDGTDADALLRAAETAMYRAKEGGRRSLRFFDASMDAELRARRKMEQDLRHATQRGEMQLAYQPLVDCRSGVITGFEALLRWHHPLRGMVPPGDFIALAEETGAITRIGHWVIDTACEEAASWAEPRHVAVNVSPNQFRHSDVPGIVAAALARTGLDPRRLEIEITEGVFIDDAARAVTVLSGLRALGVRLALDDFGTGYSSLSYLRLFTFDKIKIDQSFLPDLGQKEDATTIVKAIINLGHNLGLSVTVEGVETAEQLALVRELGGDQVQGYLLGRPGPIESFSVPHMTQVKTLFFAAPETLTVEPLV